ncbi:tripartite tricarboxylate transporter substrate binding protein [Roseomonas alkaliterrae]|uniref:Tripartite-type tricarboxylate transporter receptor subunit TctC n=1 Tax=Neoroseomonas alkaliterrae TaxID=1452450 RepID=A0A840XPF3_9PROT|nr:tripartite tricarboxylate transporter substrate binding protein [Neoroseomonas alkaliterrae]MBB5688690.1 tripartite-type tricarboxylate transporter receptor subunit TctC [Neoroseomonas alkaliterrae]MBR0675235.1 tripartite tricarboxylate transporter substrate binding protein [Neoroseomonas alkaliterrae]
MATRRALLAGAGLLAAPATLRAQAAWPGEKPMEVIVPFPPGGGVDVMTRLIMPLVAAQIPGLRHVVVNRTGAAGQIGLEATFNAAADGYTIGATTIPAHNAIPLERQVRYRAMDFTFIANVVEDPNAFFVRADSPFRTVADVVAAARARPGHVTYGTTGIGSDDHLFMLAFEAAAGLQPMVQVPFAGAAPLIPQLLGGNMDLAVLNVNDAPQLVREGRLRMLAQGAAQRRPEASDVPTFREAGFDVIGSASRGIVGPPNMPPAVVQRLTAAFRAALNDEGFRREAERQFMPLRPLVGEEYRAFAQSIDDNIRRLWQTRPWRG